MTLPGENISITGGFYLVLTYEHGGGKRYIPSSIALVETESTVLPRGFVLHDPPPIFFNDSEVSKGKSRTFESQRSAGNISETEDRRSTVLSAVGTYRFGDSKAPHVTVSYVACATVAGYETTTTALYGRLEMAEQSVTIRLKLVLFIISYVNVFANRIPYSFVFYYFTGSVGIYVSLVYIIG